MRRRAGGLVLAVGLASACGGDDGVVVDDFCGLRALPFTAGGEAPVVVDVALEVQPTGLVFLLTATDPQGSDDLIDVVQTVGIHRDRACAGTPVTATDDLACSGCEESFGTVVPASATLYGAVSGATLWPVAVTIADAGGHVTSGNVGARVVR